VDPMRPVALHVYRRGVIRCGGTTIIVGAAFVAALSAAPVLAVSTPRSGEAAVGVPGNARATEYSLAVTYICGGSLLFDHAHHMGTRADALAVARDIRASTARRLARVTALSVPRELKRTSSRWIVSQRRLAASYARIWVRIYDTIDGAHTPAQRATLPERLHQLVHAPDRLRLAASHLELELNVPDCTGGGSDLHTDHSP
jgi:hypothetical protein